MPAERLPVRKPRRQFRAHAKPNVSARIRAGLARMVGSGGVAGLAAWLGLTLFASDLAAQRGPGGPALVGIDTVIEGTNAETIPVIGRFVAPESGVIATRIAERVSDMMVQVGDRVDRGEALARLSSDRLLNHQQLRQAEVDEKEAQLSQKRAILAKSEQALQRIEALQGSTAYRKDRSEDGVHDINVAKGALGQARAELLRARANLAGADTAFGDAEIRAPYPGVVLALHTVAGNYVRTGDPIVTLLNDAVFEIEADIPERRTTRLTPGTPVKVTLQDGTILMSEVRTVVPRENPRTLTRVVRFTMAEGEQARGIADNQSVTLEIPIGSDTASITVHKDAIVIFQGRPMVYVVVEGKAEIRPVETGDAVGNRFEVLNGLKSGEETVIRGNERLMPGQAVKPLGPG